ncbi:MAG: ABC transporter ATP-binding protein [Chloroflexota bacterium]|nr:ABC transporter ATP-binding protein [Chloroflexota bacterium]
MSAIVLDDVSFAYPSYSSDTPPSNLLRGLSLSVPKGQRIAVMSAIGAGKTTLALILTGLAPAMTGGKLQGSVSIDGLDARLMSAAELSTHVGLIFQEPERQLFTMAVDQEVAFGLEGLALAPVEIRERVAWILDRTGLTGLEDRPPWQLSGGEKKRLAIAAVLAMEPSVLVLDEPMAGLDPQGRRQVARLLAELTGMTQVALEKNAEFVARWADRVVVLADGKIAMDGTPHVIFRDVASLKELGIAVPQIAELADRLRQAGEQVDFLTAQAAFDRLPQQSSDTGPVTMPAVDCGEKADASPELRSGAIDIRELVFSYEDGPRALDGVALQVPAGQFVAIVGPNGSGKSTLARHLNGLLRPQSGTVSVNGLPTEGRHVGDLARDVGYVFQNPDHQIFAATVREEIAFGASNLGFSGDALESRVDQALSDFGLEAVAETPPAILNYGMRKLVTTASVWVMQPSIWVLDEPFVGLDGRYTGVLKQHLQSLHEDGYTIVLISHDLSIVAEVAERLVVLNRGEVVMDGSVASVLARTGELARYGLRPPPITRLSRQLAPLGFPHPILTVDQFMQQRRSYSEALVQG